MCEVKKPKWMWNTIKLTGKCMTTKITAENLIMVDRISTNKLCQKMKSHIQQQASQQLCIVERRDKFVGSFFLWGFSRFSSLCCVWVFLYDFKGAHTSSIEQYTCHKMFYDRNIMYWKFLFSLHFYLHHTLQALFEAHSFIQFQCDDVYLWLLSNIFNNRIQCVSKLRWKFVHFSLPK